MDGVEHGCPIEGPSPREGGITSRGRTFLRGKEAKLQEKKTANGPSASKRSYITNLGKGKGRNLDKVAMKDSVSRRVVKNSQRKNHGGRSGQLGWPAGVFSGERKSLDEVNWSGGSRGQKTVYRRERAASSEFLLT